jgi:uncharacterized protein YjiS (DUF1127 family)
MSDLTQFSLITPRRVSLAILRTWHRRFKTRRQLRKLDARLLDDVGLSEAERRHECAKWFWRE